MLKLLFTLAFVFVVGFAGVLLARYDFPITAEFNDYLVETSAARLAVILVFSLTIFYGVVKFLFWLKNSPKRVLSRMKKEHEEQGLQNIMSGFSALAAGNPAKAKKLADKAEKALPKQPLVKLLQAQVAVHAGDRALAESYYKKLAETEEGSFVGFRGLISQAMADNDPKKAMKIADELLLGNPKSSWLNEALIDLAFRIQDWDKLERYLKKAEANKALDKKVLYTKLGVYYFMKAKIAHNDGRMEDAEWLAQRSLKYKDDFLPAALFITDIYNEEGKFRKTGGLVFKFWQTQTHPVFMKNYAESLLGRGIRTKARRVKKLYSKNPNDVESAAFYAKVLIEEHNSAEAREVISSALKIRETKGLCLLMSQVDDKIAWQNRAEKAAEDKCWYCKITGARYSEWQLYSDSGELNTIVWGFPPEAPKSMLSENKFLFIS